MPDAVKILLYGVPAFLLLLIAVLGVLALTGRKERGYEVLSPEQSVEVAGRQVTVSRLAEEYRPKMYLRSSTPSPELLHVWYEAVPADSTIDLVYYHVWEDEINPHATIHKLYSLFRAAYYGYPLYDIEYFQVSVDRETGAVEGLLFETSRSEDFFQKIPEHLTARYALNPDGTYRAVFTTGDGEETGRNPSAEVLFDGNRVLAGVQTWNHLSRLLESRKSDYDTIQQAELQFLTGKEYRRHKFVRKSQGDHRTH